LCRSCPLLLRLPTRLRLPRAPPFPYTTLFRSSDLAGSGSIRVRQHGPAVLPQRGVHISLRQRLAGAFEIGAEPAAQPIGTGIDVQTVDSVDGPAQPVDLGPDTDLAAPDRPQTLDEPGAADAIGKPVQQEQDLGMPSGQGDLPAVRTPQGGFGAEDDEFASGRLGVGSKHSLRSVELGQLR